QKK
ncbi:Late embryogenesis abundant protein, partial [Haemophilus influenzae]